MSKQTTIICPGQEEEEVIKTKEEK